MRKPSHYYDRQRRKARTLSVAMHFIFLLIAFSGLPDLLEPSPPEEPQAITVDLLPISEMSNVKPSDSPAQDKKEEKQEAKPNPKPTPPVKVADDTPPPPPEPVPAPKQPEKEKPKPKPEKKKEEPKKEDKKKKPKEVDLQAILQSVKKEAEQKKEQKKDSGNDKPAKSNSYNPGLPMSLSEKDAIRSQIAKCWNVPAGAKDAHQLLVTLRIKVGQDGSVLSVELASESQSRANADPFFRAAADSAVRAVRECSPLKNLPVEKYATWRDMELTFDPKEMLF